MSQINIVSGSSPLPLKQVVENPVEQARTEFGEIIKETISKTVAAESQGNEAIEGVVSGQAKNLHEVMLTVEKADISLKMLVQFRNKALQAYEEIMRLQI